MEDGKKRRKNKNNEMKKMKKKGKIEKAGQKRGLRKP